MELSKAKEQVIKIGRELAREGYIARTWGNVSCRVDPDHFVISASGKDYETLSDDEIIELDMDMNYKGNVKPSSEKRVHREIYRLKDDAGFIVHTHQHNASAVSAMGIPVVKLDREYKGIGDFVLCSEYGLPSTTKVADKVAEAVDESIGKAVIMSNHGAVCYGSDHEEAFEIVRNLEEACGKYLEFIGVDPWDGEEEHFEMTWNNSPVIMRYIEHKSKLPAYLDDFAQMIGPSLEVFEYDEKLIDKAAAENKPLLIRGYGAMCNAENPEDRVAMSMLIEKNCRAALAGIGCRPIGMYESLFMRQFYLQKYSKLKYTSEEETD